MLIEHESFYIKSIAAIETFGCLKIQIHFKLWCAGTLLILNHLKIYVRKSNGNSIEKNPHLFRNVKEVLLKCVQKKKMGEPHPIALDAYFDKRIE